MICINHKNGIFFVNKNDYYHRDKGPSIIGRNCQAWYENGKRHRLDGPAYIKGYNKEYWIEGEKYTKYAYHKKMGLCYDIY
jgi:hypothetical protein